MDELTPLQVSMYADGACDAEEKAAIEAHLAGSETSRARVAAYVAELEAISGALTFADDTVDIPAFADLKLKRRITLREFAIANLATGVLLWSASFLWKTLFGELIVSASARLTEVFLPDAYNLATGAVLYLFTEGNTMLETYPLTVATVLAGLTIAWLVAYLRHHRGAMAAGVALMVAMGVSSPEALAIEHRGGDDGNVTLAADETVEDTLILTGRSIVVDGNVTGNLLAFAERIIVNGEIGGNVITAGESIAINGKVGGTVLSAGSSVELAGAVVAKDAFAAAGKVEVDRGSSVGGNLVVTSERAELGGTVTRDVLAFSENVEVSGEVGEDLIAGAEELNLLRDARVNGDIRFYNDDENDLVQAPEATVLGAIEFLGEPEERRNRYADPGYYVTQLIRLAGAILAGFLLLWLLPAVRDVELTGGADGAATAGFGLAALVATPVLIVLMAVTLVGFPLAILTLFAWFAAIYFAKIVLAMVLGRLILEAADMDDTVLLTLVAGLATIIIAVNIPGIGGLLNFLMTIVGLGLVVRMILDYIRDVDGEIYS